MSRQIETVRRIVLEGELQIIESEGGFAPDGFQVGNTWLADAIAELLDLKMTCRGSIDAEVAGPIRITLERSVGISITER